MVNFTTFSGDGAKCEWGRTSAPADNGVNFTPFSGHSAKCEWGALRFPLITWTNCPRFRLPQVAQLPCGCLMPRKGGKIYHLFVGRSVGREWWWWLRHSSCCPTRIRVTICHPYVCYTSFVSILTRPWGRVQRRSPCTYFGVRCCFNPHPPVGAGATVSLP